MKYVRLYKKIYCVNMIKNTKLYIKKWDNYRSEYYMYHTGKEWEKMSNYDLCINTGELGIEKSVKYIKEYIKLRMETL